MPELPEVETIRRQLARKIIGKRLDKKTIKGLRRRGKFLIIDFKEGSSLVIHLKLTGQLVFNGRPNKYTRHIFKFNDNSQLLFNDARKLGWWKVVESSDNIEKRLGPEALKISLAGFEKALLKRPQARIKPLLMDQKFIAGLGNIYSDEILFAARINPSRRVKTLSGGERKRIYENMAEILKAAINSKGSSVRYYLDAGGKKGAYVKYHNVYQRDGKKCLRCGATIKKIKLGGRSARFCPNCQKP